MKKLLLTLTLIASLVLSSTSVLAHNESDTSTKDQQNNNTTTTTAVAEDFDFTTDADNTTVNLLYADGTPLANASVTVKNGLTGQDGDIVQNQTADANGAFNYGEWVSQGVAVLRVTDPKTNSAVEYNIENGTMTIEAGKGSGGGGGDRTAQTQTSKSNTYIMIAGVVGVLVIATVGVIVMQKKKKSAFEASQAKKKSKKSK